MHLLFVQKVENFSGCKEETFKEIPPDNLLMLRESTLMETRNVATKNLKDHPHQKRCNVQNHRRGVILSHLLKEEPPDAPCITKPKLYQGKVLNSQERMKPDLLYLGAGYPVSRTKICQGGGYDAAIKPVAEPEVNPKPYSTIQGANQDTHALKMPYLTNQEVLNDRDNFYGYYTQEGVQANWNRAKVFTEQEVMNFTSQRFLSPSISEYPTLEEDSSPMKNRPEEKPIIGFQKAQDQEKWPRILGVMINFPETAKPTSSMESLQPIQLGSTQSYFWEPGDHLNHSGGIPEVLSCTRTHRIRRILEEVLKPTRSHLWKYWTIFRFNLFQANQSRPEDIQTKPRPSEDIMHEPEEFYEFIPCTSNHWIRRILIYSNLPYLEQTDINVQQLFSPQIRHEISREGGSVMLKVDENGMLRDKEGRTRNVAGQLINAQGAVNPDVISFAEMNDFDLSREWCNWVGQGPFQGLPHQDP
ncbi:hypothetical protein DY000_02033300 [Brassica cretica]|uniref:Uncharacterized protein n=1 Tax=Brassica cretica TaxID=69181 RepID=A0ABQ7DKI3_BRACR|nr:hypothetical protein DY000_02033300 [Brassica cretica]